MSTQFAVDLVFKTQGSSQLKTATSNVDKLSQASKKAQGNATGAANNIRKLGTSAKSSSAGVKALGTAFSSMLGPIALVTAAVAAVGKAFSAAADKEKEVAAMRQGLSNLGIEGEAVLNALQQKAKEFGETTLFSPTQYREAVTSLTSFRNIAVKDFDAVINISADVAQAMGTNVKDASLQLAKALNAPSQNLSALSRSGIQFTQQQKDQIKAMEQAGNIAGAQALIMKELETQYKGVSAAAGKGLAGGFDLLGQRIQEAFEALGEFLEPLAGPLLAGAVSAIEGMMDMWSYIADNIFPKVAEALEPITKYFEDTDWTGILAQIGEMLQNSVIIWLEQAVKILGNLSTVVGVVIGAFKKLSENPVFKFIADNVARLADMLGLSGGKMAAYKAEQDKAAAGADAVLAGVEPVAPAIEDAEAAAKKLAEAEKEVTKSIQEATKAIDEEYKAQESLNQLTFELAQKRRDVEKQIVSNLLDQAEAQLDAAATAQERETAAKKIYELTIQQAKIEKEIAQAAVKEDLRKAEAQVQMLVMKEKEVAIEVSLAAANKTLNQEHLNALQLTRDALGLAQQQLGTKQEIAAAQMSEIDAIYKGKEATAKMAYEQNRVFEATKQSESSATGFATQMERAAAAAAKIKGGGSKPWSLGKTSTFVDDNNWNGASQEAVNAAFSQNQGLKNYGRQDDNGNWSIAFGSQQVDALNPNSSKRLMQDIQKAVDRETEQRDPNSDYNQMINRLAIEKEKQAQQYQAAQSGNANVSVEYNGDRINMNNNDYVSTKDVSGIVNSAVSAMQNKMTRSSKSRLEMGMT